MCLEEVTGEMIMAETRHTGGAVKALEQLAKWAKQ